MAFAYHYWGDEDFEDKWSVLNEAQDYMCKLYHRCRRKCPMTKEKYGTVRYEFLCMWLLSNEDVDLFCKIIVRAVKRYPIVAAEIMADWPWLIDHPYYTPYFKGAMMALRATYVGEDNECPF